MVPPSSERPRIPGDNGMRSTPIATGGKNRVKRKEGWHNGERRCRSPSRAQAKGQIPRFTGRCGKLTESQGNRSRFGGKERRGKGLLQDYCAPEYLRVKRKRFLGQTGRFRNRLYNLGDIIGALIMDVERQSISNRHKYLQAIADLESVSFI